MGGARRGRPCGGTETNADRELESGQDGAATERGQSEAASHVPPAFSVPHHTCSLPLPSRVPSREGVVAPCLHPPCFRREPQQHDGRLSVRLLARAARVPRPMQHIAASDAPALALDDIFHTMSPSPTPQPLPPEPSTSTLPEHHFSFDGNTSHNAPITDYIAHIPRTHSPEPLDYSELEAMRARVQECALSHNAREAEFAAMVRLSVIWPAVLA